MIGQLARQIERNWDALGLSRPPRPSTQRWLVMNGGIGVQSKLVCLLWARGGSQPDFVVKFGRDPIYNGRLSAEFGALQALQRYARGGPVPTPLLTFELNDLQVTVETAVPGRLLRLFMREHPHLHLRTLRGFETLVRWLIDVHSNSARPATGADMQAFVFEPLESAIEDHGDFSAREAEGIDRLHSLAKEMMTRATLPIVFNHNDLTATNLLVTRDGAPAGIIDWEFASPGLPMLDLFYFLASYGQEARGTGRGQPLPGFRELFFAPQSTAAGALPLMLGERWIAEYCRRLAVDPGWLPVLFGLTWLWHARNERRRIVELHDQGQPFPECQAPRGSTAPGQPIFRSSLRYFLENWDRSVVAALAGGVRA